MAITLKGILADIVPVFAGLLPGPFGPMVQKVIGEVLGKPIATQADIDAALATATPEQIIALKDKERQFVLDFKQKDIDLVALANQDRDSARGMQIATRAKTPAVLASVVVVGWIVLMVALFHGDIPATSRDIVIQAVGTMGGALMMVIGFYFGSSSSSSKKDETIAKLSE